MAQAGMGYEKYQLPAIIKTSSGRLTISRNLKNLSFSKQTI